MTLIVPTAGAILNFDDDEWSRSMCSRAQQLPLVVGDISFQKIVAVLVVNAFEQRSYRHLAGGYLVEAAPRAPLIAIF